jgi:hypothetical protein
MRNFLRLASSTFLTLAAVGCGGSGGGPPGGGTPAMAVVGASGGGVTSTDGALQVTVPAGALPSDVTITVASAAAPGAGALGTTYEIGPTGTQFAMPVTLTLHYDAAGLAGTAASSLRVATFASGSWQILPGTVLDAQAKTVSGLTTHLSPYAIVAEASGKVCATIQTAPRCTQSTNTGGGTSGGGAPVCTTDTCASIAAGSCSGYPGATMDSCVDGTNGPTAACCFAAGAPVCFAVGGGGAKCTDTGGAGGATCPPPPTCATAGDVCAGYPGATLQGCTDSASGFNGGCCFAAQTPVCIAVYGGGAKCTDTGGTAGGTSCPPPPTCAGANPCAGYPGATVQGCTDSASGYQATCCFPLGTLPMAGSGSSSGGSTGVDAGMVGGSPDGGSVTCAPGAACAPGSGCGGTSAGGACMQCTCDATGVYACGPCGTKLDGGQPPPDDGGSVTCAPGAACAPGSGCGGTASDGTCLQCSCDGTGVYVCGSCGGTKPDGGQQPPPDGGGQTTCAPGAACAPGSGCGGTASDGTCLQCTCDGTGVFVCGSCGGTKPDGGGQTTCAPGAACAPGSGCGGTSPSGACMQCTCDGTGVFVCGPCGTSPDGGSATACQVTPVGSGSAGSPCGVMEGCPDGTNYRVQCDGTGSPCMCVMQGVPTGTMPTLSCTGLDPLAALKACGFPAGTL